MSRWSPVMNDPCGDQCCWISLSVMGTVGSMHPWAVCQHHQAVWWGHMMEGRDGASRGTWTSCRGEDWEQPTGEELGGVGGCEAGQDQRQPRPPHVLGWSPAWAEWGGDSAPLPCSGDTPPAELPPALGPNTGIEYCWSEVLQIHQGLEPLFTGARLGGLGDVQPGEEKAPERP